MRHDPGHGDPPASTGGGDGRTLRRHPVGAVLRPGVRVRAHPGHRPDGRGPDGRARVPRRADARRALVVLDGLRVVGQHRPRRRGHHPHRDVRLDGRRVRHRDHDPRGVRRRARRTARPHRLRGLLPRRCGWSTSSCSGSSAGRTASSAGRSCGGSRRWWSRTALLLVAGQTTGVTQTLLWVAVLVVDLGRRLPRGQQLAAGLGGPLRRAARADHPHRAGRVDRRHRHRHREGADLLADHRGGAARPGGLRGAVVGLLRRHGVAHRARAGRRPRRAADPARPFRLHDAAPPDDHRRGAAVVGAEEGDRVRRGGRRAHARRPALRGADGRPLRRHGPLPARARLVQALHDGRAVDHCGSSWPCCSSRWHRCWRSCPRW